MVKKMNVSVVIPVYNEEETIIEVIRIVKRVLDNCPGVNGYEVIVIDDASIDKTFEKLTTEKDIRLIHHVVNQGYGASLKHGIRVAKYEIIAITDGDGSYENEKLGDLIKWIDNYDMVVGERNYLKGSVSWIKMFGKIFITRLANYVAGTKIPDLNSGFRVMRRSIVMKFNDILPSGFSFTSTITLAAMDYSFKIKYIKINYRKRKGRSKIKVVRDFMNFIQLIIRTCVYFNPLKIFVSLSILIFMIGLLILITGMIFGKFFDITFVVLSIGAIQIFSIGMLADLINRKFGHRG